MTLSQQMSNQSTHTREPLHPLADHWKFLTFPIAREA